jgi:hypothetical protein
VDYYLLGFDERAVRWMVIAVSKDRYIISSHNDLKIINFREDIGIICDTRQRRWLPPLLTGSDPGSGQNPFTTQDEWLVLSHDSDIEVGGNKKNMFV